ncbi:hypothetical protein NF212_21600 [Parasalinivibrio latis]|uniref:hypothetical protein n=1 Tax=Parasalinivibrio latis TaxID=2952610 RepID=UPI0030E3753D
MKKLIVLCCLVLTACSSPYSPIDDENLGSKPITGLYQPDSASSVFMIHGMCPHTKDWADDFVEDIAKKLALKQIKAESSPLAFTVADDKNTNPERHYFLKEYSLAREGYLLNIYSFNYAYFNNIRSLGNLYDDFTKAKINGSVKDQLVSGCLSDVTTYGGKRGQDIRTTLLDAIDYVEKEDAKLPVKPNKFFVSESLGSKILRDVLVCDEIKSTDNAAGKALSNTQTVFMASNQLPLLNAVNSCVSNPTATFADAIKQLSTTKRLRPSFHVVSFTDPNDLLSYDIDTDDYAEKGVSSVSIPVSNATTWFGLFAEPFKTHTGYLENKDVLDIIACGSNGCQ